MTNLFNKLLTAIVFIIYILITIGLGVLLIGLILLGVQSVWQLIM